MRALPAYFPDDSRNLVIIVLYTGGARVARVVSAAAAKHLTPVTLEVSISARSLDRLLYRAV